jgi:hypothetical protein
MGLRDTVDYEMAEMTMARFRYSLIRKYAMPIMPQLHKTDDVLDHPQSLCGEDDLDILDVAINTATRKWQEVPPVDTPTKRWCRHQSPLWTSCRGD